MPLPRPSRRHAARLLAGATLAMVMAAPAATGSHGRAGASDRWDAAAAPTAVVGYRTRADLARTLRAYPGVVLRTIPALGVAEILPRTPPRDFAQAAGRMGGIEYVEPPVLRTSDADQALQAASTTLPGGVLEWQYPAVHLDLVPDAVKRAAASVTIAVIDTGADLTAPDIGVKAPLTYSVVGGGHDVRDTVGHGTFVSALAAGSDTNGDGIAGFGGSAKLMVVQASRTQTSFTDVDEAAAVVWAVDHGARIINLSLGGPDTSTTERSAIAYAVKHGVLVVAAIGNEHDESNPVEYPAALVQPVGSSGKVGSGLSVGASDDTGARAGFSNTGSHLSLVAPGVDVLSAISSTAPDAGYVRTPLPGSAAGEYAFGSGTSFAAPEVSGVAALVWAANPRLSAQQVARILQESASNRGRWNPDTGYGVIDAAAAVQTATSQATAGAAPATLSLSATATRGKGPLTFSVQAALSPAAASRTVTLEAYTGGHWQQTTSGKTNSEGKTTWQFALDRGVYRIRARFAGDATIRAALSRTVSVTVS